MQISHVSRAEIKQGEAVKGEDIREGIFILIQSQFPDFDKEKYISIEELNKFRRLYLSCFPHFFS